MRILGIEFFDGESGTVVETMCTEGGLLVAPSGTCFSRLQRDAAYRTAISGADVALPDSGFMVLLWRILRGGRVDRISGLAYLKRLLQEPALRAPNALFWILPNQSARERAVAWGAANGFQIADANSYLAPFYESNVQDAAVVALIDERRPAHVVIGIGAGPQEKLGYYLREHLIYRPAIHCVGGAVGMLTGDQKSVPDWADRFYLGWLIRLIANPRVFVPRLARGFTLPFLILKYGEEMPPLAERKK